MVWNENCLWWQRKNPLFNETPKPITQDRRISLSSYELIRKSGWHKLDTE